MKYLKIRVNNEAESKEAQELFFELGYQWAYKNIGKNIFYEKEDIFLYADKGGSLGTGTKENQGYFNGWCGTLVSLPELRDLVVLKRNSIDDATHEDCGNKYYIATSGDLYGFVIDKWLLCAAEKSNTFKPIEKPMKEYLRKNNDGEYILEVTDEREAQEPHAKHWIEVPEGAETATMCAKYFVFWKNNTDSFSKLDGDTDWTRGGDNMTFDEYMATHDDISIVWQRTTHPEELPFIDDEPKITTAKGSELDYIAKIHDMRDRYDGESDEDYRYQLEHYISRKESSLNDQYAEIEKVRQSHRTASEIADSALKHIRERAETYDQPTGERSAAKTAKAFNAITGKDITEPEVWLLLQLLKDVRQWSREDYHQDSAEDCIAYASLKAESLEGEK